MSDDLIRRQDAIDALARIAREKFNLSDEYNQYLAGLTDGENAIWRLPSAEPEIIRCKECKYRGETEDGEYNPEDIVCAYWMSDGLSETDYCSYAERRK